MIESCRKTIAGTNTSTSGHVYNPLVVDGKTVRGGRVYVGPAAGSNKKPAAEVGTVYLSGLKIGRTVLEQPANGWGPKGKSGAVPTAKRVIAREFNLPSRRYVMYKLEDAGSWVLNLGGAAATAADKDGVTADPKAVKEITLALAS
jgi:hypothetical protein